MKNNYKSKSNSKEMFVIDGSIGEGGGSILRISAGMACLFNKKLYIFNIRKGRKKPGLRLQHLIGIETLAKITGGKTNKIGIGSTSVKFFPGKDWNSNIDVTIKTAGSIGMLSQTLYNSLYLAPYSPDGFTINVEGGGTYAKYAPGPTYLNNVTFEIFRNLGYNVHLNILKQGFYPKGGGKATIIIKPASSISNYNPLILEEREELEYIGGVIHVEERLKQPKVAERILKSIKKNVNPHLSRGVELNIIIKYHESLSIGVGVDLYCKFSNDVILGTGTILGERGISSEKVGKRSALKLNELLKSKCTVDEYACDQILPLLFLVEKPSTFKLNEITRHFRTNLKLLEHFFNRKSKIEKKEGHYIFELF